MISQLDKVLMESGEQLLEAIKRAPMDYSKWWWQLVERNPYHVMFETSIIVFLLYVMLFKRRNLEGNPSVMEQLKPSEIDELVSEWEPRPLLEVTEEEMEMERKQLIVEGRVGLKMQIKGYGELLNFSTWDFLGFGSDPEVLKTSVETLDAYSCGSCGPRGFYGTSDKHLQIERDLESFLNVEEVIAYSDASSTPSSVIPAFAKRGDLLIADEGVNASIQVGMYLSRANILYFKHNDMEDLERILLENESRDKKAGRKVSDQRRFIVVEGLYRNFGDIVPIDKVIEYKRRFKARIVIDESVSFGVLGVDGRGVCEMFGFTLNDVDIWTSSLANTLASVGGFCAGSSVVCDHQKLSAAGYVFSAASPAFTNAAASTALKLLKERPAVREKLAENCEALHAAMNGITGLVVDSDPASPVCHVRIAPEYSDGTEEGDNKILDIIVDHMLERGILVRRSRYIHPTLTPLPRPSLRIITSTYHDLKHIKECANALKSVAKDVLGKNMNGGSAAGETGVDNAQVCRVTRSSGNKGNKKHK